jgi:hypothetical protein
MGIVPSAMPRTMPMKNGIKCVSLSSLSELPSTAAALSRSSSRPTICTMSPNCSRRPGTADISMPARVIRVTATPNRSSRSSSPTVLPSTERSVTTTRRKVMPLSARTRSSSLRWPMTRSN